MAPEPDPHESLRHSIALGLSLIAAGAGLLVYDGLALSALWPFFPLAVGTSHFTRPDARDGGRKSLRSGVWWTFVGAWGLGNVHGVLGMTYRETWPIVVVVAGVMLVWEAMDETARQEVRR